MTDKYREFRNFMVNELGITRDDIEAWTKEAVAMQVNKLLGQMNLDALAARETRSQIQNVVGTRDRVGHVVTLAMAAVLSDKIEVTLKDASHD